VPSGVPHTARLRRGSLLALLALTALLLGSCGGGKSYTFPEVRIDATVNQDGSLSIEERRTFDFHGDFSFGFFTVEHKSFSDVVDFQVSEGADVYEEGAADVPGHVLYEDPVLEGPGNFKFKATWWFDAHDEQRTWTFRYRVLCAVDVFADTAHLLWKFIGEGWTVPTDHAVVSIHVPGRLAVHGIPPARPDSPCNPSSIVADGVPPIPELQAAALAPGETRAWGHGPLHGNVTLSDPQTILLDIRDLDPATFVEGSVVFPAESVPLEYQSPESGLQQILDEEARMAAESNALRIEARRAERRHERWRLFGWAVLVALPILSVLAALWVRRREHVDGLPMYLSEPPEEQIRPALLALEWSMYRRRLDAANAFRAQILEMARERALEIVPLGTVSESRDYELRKLADPPNDLDAKFVDALFLEDNVIATKEFKPGQKQLQKLGDWWEGILKAAKGSGAGRHRSLTMWLWVIAFSTLYWAIPLAILNGLPGWYPVLAQAVTIACVIAVRRLVPVRYSPERAERMQRWWAFRRWLLNFHTLTDAPAAAIVIWERYLAFAVALGIADRVEKQIRAIVPQTQLPQWQGAGAINSASLSHVFSSMATDSIARGAVGAYTASHMTYSTSGSSSSFSSSSGSSGGGFSSGGGGGGGGTGGGAG
jgi:uncharacterized membrane protein YgcG